MNATIHSAKPLTMAPRVISDIGMLGFDPAFTANVTCRHGNHARGTECR